MEGKTAAWDSKINLLTWNIGDEKVERKLRMEDALEHVDEICIEGSLAKRPSVIIFKELGPSDLECIKAAPWVRSDFCITHVDGYQWKPEGQHGTTALIDHRLATTIIGRVPQPSKQDP